ETSQYLLRQFAQSLALGEQPLLERRRRHAQAGEEIAPVQGRGAGQRLVASCGRLPFEGRDIGRYRSGLDADGLSVSAEDVGVCQGRAQCGEGLTKAGTGLRVGNVTPKECGQLVPGMEVSSRQRQVGEQRLRLASREVE